VLQSSLGVHKDDLNFENLRSIFLRFDVDENEKPNLPIQTLQKVPNLHKMSISSCHYLEAFHTEIDKNKVLTDLKVLELIDVWELKSIGSGDAPWLDKICEELQELYIRNCPHFTALIYSSCKVCFSNLKTIVCVQLSKVGVFIHILSSRKVNSA